jgi:hypothetical protein
MDLFLTKIYEKWVPKLEKAFKAKGISVNEAKLQELAEMAHARQINEFNGGAYASLDGANGRTDFAFGNNPNSGNAGFYAADAKGSGEVMQSLFNVFIETVHHCVAFDLLPNLTQQKSSGVIYIMEPVYGGGALDSKTKKPMMIQVKATKMGAAAALVVGTTYTLKKANAGESIAPVTFVGIHKINGNFVFKVGDQLDNSGASGTNWQNAYVKDLFDSPVNGSGIYTNGTDYWKFDAASVDLLPGFLSYVGGFSGAGQDDTDPWFLDRGNGTRYAQPMSRKTGQKTYYRSMGIRTWNKNFSADTVHVDIEYTTEQLQDAKHDHGIDLRQMGDKILQNELTQHINDHALGRIFALGWSNHKAMVDAGGPNMNIFVGASSSTGSALSFLGKDDTLLTIAGSAGVLPATGAISENLSTLQRRLVTRLYFASDVINYRSKRGRGDTAVLNTTLGSALKDIRQFEANKFENNLNNSQVYYAGKINGIDIYIDPYMELNDYRVACFRKGGKDDPGIKMCPYLLAEKIVTISEGTMAPKEALKSRYKIVEAGSYPELNYLTFFVESSAGYSLV